MNPTQNIVDQVEILKSVGHKSRTLLNGITGPVQIIRSLSDEPKLIDPLRILELSVTRFERFSVRSLLLSNMLSNNFKAQAKPVDLTNMIRYVILELTDLLDFYNVKIELKNECDKTINTDYDLLNQCIMILFEQLISLNDEQSVIKVEFDKTENFPICKISCSDNGFIQKSLNSALYTSEYPTEIDIFVLKQAAEKLKMDISLSASSGNETTIALKLN